MNNLFKFFFKLILIKISLFGKIVKFLNYFDGAGYSIKS